MKRLIIFISFTACSANAFCQNFYTLGENEFSEEKEQATVITAFTGTTLLPDSIDLSYLMPPAGDQGTKGSCWAWATTYVVRSTMDNSASYLTSNQLDLKKVYSPEFVYQYYKGDQEDCYWGEISSDILGLILKNGAVKFNDFPYEETKCNNQPSGQLKQKAKQFAKPDYKSQVINTLSAIKKTLSEKQPLVISIKVDDFFCTKGNITKKSPYWKEFHEKKGSHAMVVVGYNNRMKALKVLNSWGTGFGDKGYVWITYDIVKAYMNYCCYPKKELESLPVTTKSNEEISIDPSMNVSLNSITSWFKEGYYRPFEQLKIVLSKLSVSKKFAVIEIRDSDYNLKTNFYIEVKSSKEFFIDGEKYKFTFDNIDRAGRNPFNKAVYFTLHKIK